MGALSFATLVLDLVASAALAVHRVVVVVLEPLRERCFTPLPQALHTIAIFILLLRDRQCVRNQGMR